MTEGHPVLPALEGFPHIHEIDYAQEKRVYRRRPGFPAPRQGLGWHTDVTFVARPPAGSLLNALVIPQSGGDTMWSDQQAAFEGLSSSLQDYLGTLHAVHDGRAAFQFVLDAVGEGRWEGEPFTSLDPVVHPVVRTHPETGARTLFVNPGFTTHIVELERPESDALLGFLYQHSVQPEYTVRYHWHVGDLGFWDNRATQHSVAGDYGDHHRLIQRVTLPRRRTRLSVAPVAPVGSVAGRTDRAGGSAAYPHTATAGMPPAPACRRPRPKGRRQRERGECPPVPVDRLDAAQGAGRSPAPVTARLSGRPSARRRRHPSSPSTA